VSGVGRPSLPNHTVITIAFGPDGRALGELPEQVPYLEWKHSAYCGRQSMGSRPIEVDLVLPNRRIQLAVAKQENVVE
jgi:hypothetical protein